MNEVERAKDAIKKAQTVVSELCNGTRRWVMRVPAQLDDDPDLVIATALNLAKAVIEKSEAASLLPLLSDVASKDVAGIEGWHWNEPIPQPFDVLAVLRSKSGAVVWSKVSSVFPIDDNWSVVCWTFVNLDAVVEAGLHKAAM